jgi:3-oxoadipyl-CoA thiolase
MTRVYLCDGVRTPFGRYGGALAGVRADDLAAVPLRAMMNRHAGLDWAALDEVILGCANQAGEDNRNVARMALLLAGLPHTVPGITVNRLCASGLDAIATAARTIKAGEAELILAGGVESMTRAPFVMGKPESAFGRAQTLEDTTMGWRFINPALQAAYGTDSMPQTGERVAEEYGISRDSQDQFALRSQARTARAIAAGLLAQELCPVTLPKQRGQAEPAVVSQDEHPRPGTTLEALAKLKGVVRPDGTVTAGNASGINDGAAVVLVASEAAVARHGLNPIARIVQSTSVGVLPAVMGIGPVPAVQKLLAVTGLDLPQIDVIELNEAFASQSVAVLRALGLSEDAEFVNPNGGAIALGHPLGASGARLVLSAARELARREGTYAVCTLCVGVGQGAALLLEGVS